MIRTTFLEMYKALKDTQKILTEETCRITGINDIITGWSNKPMGQIDSYKLLQQQMLSQSQMQNQLQNMYGVGNIAGQGIAGSLLGASQLGQLQEPLYPGKVLYPEGYRRAFLHDREVQELAIIHDFEYKFDSDSFVHKNGDHVTRQQIEDCSRSDLPKLFIRAKTPNISWLDKRVDEIRVKLC